MAGQNRKSLSQTKGRSARAFFRGAFILLVALTLSFGLGFFVLARMIPANANDNAGSGGSGSNEKDGAASGKQPHHDPDPGGAPAQPHPPINRTAPHQHVQDGPTLLPDTEVQQPDNVDANRKHSGSNGTEEGDGKGDGSTGAENGGAGTAGDDSGDETSPKRNHRSRGASEQGGAVQPAGSPDAPTTRAAQSAAADGAIRQGTAAGAPNGSATVKKGLYRVQIGVYSTREKAEEMARTAADKGITTSVRVFTKDGRTLYRVQHSAHQDRAKAESDMQKLLDAGLDASISDPT